MRNSAFALSALLVGFAVSTPCATAQTRIGAATAVRNQVTAVLSAQEHPLAVGNPVYQDETIRTGAESVAQLLFVDQTNLSIGPRSEIRLDRFVYDPAQSTGDVAVSFTSGALRFISGTQTPNSYSIRTPVAVVGVRGTIVDFLMIERRMIAILVEGATDFTLGDGRVLHLDDPGMALEFFASGRVSRPFRWRGRYESGLEAASFPLFGNPYADTPWREGAENLDDPTNRTDELHARDADCSYCND